MGMTYEFMVAKKGTIPEDQDYYDNTGWRSVGAEMDRYDFILGFISSYTRENVEAAIKRLEQLDADVRAILAKDDIDIAFRRRLAKGLVSEIYGRREYKYEYPKEYYADDSWQVQHWPEVAWENREGSWFVRDVLTDLLPYTNGDYDIKCYAI